MIPEVDYRFGDKYLVTEFLTPENASIIAAKQELGDATGDEWGDKVAAYIRDEFEYPLIHNQPSADGQFLRYRKNILGYYFKDCVYYMWSFPAECVNQKLGICIDTANLSASLLIPKISTKVCLGEVRAVNGDRLLGYHAWVELPYNNEQYIQETTIHKEKANTLITTKGAYNKDSDWAKQGNLYYVLTAWYNIDEYHGDEAIVAYMELPANRVKLYGFKDVIILDKKKLRKEWRAEQRIKDILLREAWGIG